MGAPFNNLRSKNDRAIVAWLVSQLPQRALPNKPPGNFTYIFPANWSGEVDLSLGPVVFVKSHSGRPFEGQTGAGVWDFQVEISIVGPAAQQPGEINPWQERVAMDTLLAQTIDALSMSNDGMQTYALTAENISTAGRLLATTGTPMEQAGNADMGDYTCQYWYPALLDGGYPRAEGGAADTTNWKEIAGFRSICCGSNVS
jgi:hypothetical protein